MNYSFFIGKVILAGWLDCQMKLKLRKTSGVKGERKPSNSPPSSCA